MTYTFPAAARRYVRSPSGSLRLLVKSGELPADLRGFVYVVAPTGREVEHEGRAGTVPFLNGDGTVYRIELGDAPELRWAMTKPPCYWAELGAESDEAFDGQRARDWGITRLFDDLGLGGRNLLNTALQAVRFGSDTDRLLVTYESGRPFEIDPVTLEVLTPIGQRSAWRATLMPGTPFELVAGTSHPAFDPERDARGASGSGTVFMLNFVRDASIYAERLLRFLDLDDEYRLLSGLAAAMGFRDAVDSLLLKATTRQGPPGSSHLWPDVVKGTLEAWDRFKQRTPFVEAESQLLFWNGTDEPGRVNLLHRSGKPLSIRESGHQMGVTANYVVLIDAAFKFEMDLVFPDLDVFPNFMLEFVRRRLSRIQPQSTRFHFAPRRELVDGAHVEVKTIELPCSCVHFFVDPDDGGGEKLVIYAIDNAACDSSESLLGSDRPAFVSGSQLPPEVFGMIPCGVDVDRLLRFEVDLTGRKPTYRTTGEVADRNTMWTVALVTGPTQYTALTPTPIEDLYFFTHGLLPSAVSDLIWDLYEKPGYARRLVSRQEVAELALAGGVAPAVCRYDATRPNELADAYPLPKGWLALSPQWIPGGTRGYLFTAAFSDDEKEIWIFDAADLKKGPIATLVAPPGSELPWAYTLHTTYLREAHARPATGDYRVTMADDLVGLSSVPELVQKHVIDRVYQSTTAPSIPLARRSRPNPPPRVAAAKSGPLLSAAEVLGRVRVALGALGPVSGAQRIDDAVLRHLLDLLGAFESDPALSEEALRLALEAPAAAKEREAIFDVLAEILRRTVRAVRPVDRIVLPPSVTEEELAATFARLGVRAVREWASGAPVDAVRRRLVDGCHAYASLFRAEPHDARQSPCTRALRLQRVEAGSERRIVDALVASVLGSDF